MDITLRPYQVEALDKIEDFAARGVRRQLGVAATGLGKTVMFCALAERMKVRTLVIAHRDELIEQAAAKVREVWPDVTVGVMKAARNEIDATVVVASIQTLSRPNRLAQLTEPDLLETAAFGLVVVDEAHHSAADSYTRTLDQLGCGTPDGPLLLGVTATPDRGDGRGLDDYYDQIVWSYDIRWGIAKQYLCDMRGLRVSTGADFGDLKVTAGDYNAGQAGAMLEDADAPALVADAWLEHAKDRRTLVFTPTVATATQTRDEFTTRGVSAAMVSGETPIDERRDILDRYSRGEITVLANCAVLTEGYDEPRTDCVVVARPTKSRALYTQMVGRGTRKHPEKADCLVVDVVGATDELSLITIPSLFGIEKPEQMWDEQQSVTEALAAQVDEHRRHDQLLAAEANLFDTVRAEGFAWVAAHQPGQLRMYVLGLGPEHGTCVITERRDGHWDATHRPKSRDQAERMLHPNTTLELAQGVCEDFARRVGADRMARADAGWRQRGASDKQKKLLRKLGVTEVDGLTKGAATDLITATFASKKGRRR